MSEHITIAANAVKARLIDADVEAKLLVSDLLSYYEDGAEHTYRAKNQGWDGRSSFLQFSKGTFPAGFLASVEDHLRRKGYAVTVRRKRRPAPLGPEIAEAYAAVNPFEIDPRYDYQPETVRRLEKYGMMIAQVATGGGKCHRKGTPIIMADGSVKKVEDVRVGDRLASPTGGFRIVQNLARGRERMFEITPVKGDPFVVNASHILSLKKSGDRRTHLFDGQIVAPGATVEVTADALYRSSDHARHSLKLWRPKAVEFESDVELSLPPYVLGAWLGDGTARQVGLSSPPCRMVDEWCAFGRTQGLEVRETKGACPTWILTQGRNGGSINPVMRHLRDLGVVDGDHQKIGYVPAVYRRASVDDRLELLAGLLDSDGYARPGNRGFDFISKFERLAQDVVFVARSVGLAASIKRCQKGVVSTGFTGEYWRVAITGDCDRIPTRDKQSGERVQKKDHRVTGFMMKDLPEENYYGFELDGDRLYMLGDFTVQHNSMIGRTAVKRIMRPTLFLTTRQVLMYQMKTGFEEAGFKVGVMGDGEWRPTRGVNVGMIQTIDAKLRNPDTADRMAKLLSMFEFVILEEAHEAGSDTYFQVMNNLVNAHYRLALTATPFMRDDAEANMRLMAVSGQIGIRISEELLINRGILAKPYFKYVDLDPPHGLKRFQGWQKAYDLGVVQNDIRNRSIVDHAAYACALGLPAMILVQRKAHGQTLRDLCREAGYTTEFIYGAHDNDQRQRALDRVKSGKTQILIGSTILDVGVDVPAVGMIILAGGGKAEIGLRQRIGRGLREKKTGPNVCLVVDYADTGNKYLKRHARARREIVEATPGFRDNILADGQTFDSLGLGFSAAA